MNVQSAYGEQGELIVRLEAGGALGFDGYYKNKGATTKKILRHVFTKGDAQVQNKDRMRKR